MSVGEQLRKYRETQRLTQEELAHKVDVHVNSIRRWERDKRVPNAEKLARLAEALSTTVACLSGETNDTVLQEKWREGEDGKDRLIINNNDLHIDLPNRPESFVLLERFFDMQAAKARSVVPAM